MSIIPDRRASDQAMDPEKRPAEATKPEKRVRLTKFPDPRPLASEHFDPIVSVNKGGSLKNYLKAQDLDSDGKEDMIPQPEILEKQKDIQPLIPGTTTTSQLEMIQEKPQSAGDFPTENEKKPLSQCRLCGKITDHGFFDCPDTEKVRKMFAYCKVCNKAGHDFSDCPKATEDVLNKLAYCMICRKNTDHNTSHCQKKNGWVLYHGVLLPNVCDLCNKVGHVGEECPLDSDDDLEF